MGCQACNEIVVGKRGVARHAAMEQVGQARRGATPIGQARITLTDYLCSTCGKLWTYEDDRNDDHTGWSSVRQVTEYSEEYQALVQDYGRFVQKHAALMRAAAEFIDHHPDVAEAKLREATQAQNECMALYGKMVALQDAGRAKRN